MDNALDFALDFQELAAQGEVTQAQFNTLLAKYGGIKRRDAQILDFQDGSSARWNQEQSVWEINPK